MRVIFFLSATFFVFLCFLLSGVYESSFFVWFFFRLLSRDSLKSGKMFSCSEISRSSIPAHTVRENKIKIKIKPRTVLVVLLANKTTSPVLSKQTPQIDCF